MIIFVLGFSTSEVFAGTRAESGRALILVPWWASLTAERKFFKLLAFAYRKTQAWNHKFIILVLICTTTFWTILYTYQETLTQQGAELGRLVWFMCCLQGLRTNGRQSERAVTTSLNNPDRTNRGVTQKRNKAQTSQLNAMYRKRTRRAGMFLTCNMTKGQSMKTHRGKAET